MATTKPLMSYSSAAALLSSTPSSSSSSSSTTSFSSFSSSTPSTHSSHSTSPKTSSTTTITSSSSSLSNVTFHPLTCTWVIYYSYRSPQQRIVNYADEIKQLATFDTVEYFWYYYSHLKRPSFVPPVSEYHIFKKGVSPVWEDPANMQGGKWILRLKKGLANRYWEDLVLGLIGGTLHPQVNGIVLSVRTNEDILAVWLPSFPSSTSSLILTIRDHLKQVLGLSEHTLLEYKEHHESLKDKSSFRNTGIFR